MRLEHCLPCACLVPRDTLLPVLLAALAAPRKSLGQHRESWISHRLVPYVQRLHDHAHLLPAQLSAWPADEARAPRPLHNRPAGDGGRLPAVSGLSAGDWRAGPLATEASPPAPIEARSPVPSLTSFSLFRALNETVVRAGTATSEREALERVGDLRPHVIPMDSQMPEMDGVEATVSGAALVSPLRLPELVDDEQRPGALQSGTGHEFGVSGRAVPIWGHEGRYQLSRTFPHRRVARPGRDRGVTPEITPGQTHWLFIH